MCKISYFSEIDFWAIFWRENVLYYVCTRHGYTAWPAITMPEYHSHAPTTTVPSRVTQHIPECSSPPTLGIMNTTMTSFDGDRNRCTPETSAVCFPVEPRIRKRRGKLKLRRQRRLKAIQRWPNTVRRQSSTKPRECSFC